MYTYEHDDHIADADSTADVAFPYLTSKKKTEPSKRSNRGSYPHLLNTYQYQPSFPSCSQEQAGIASNPSLLPQKMLSITKRVNL